MSGRPLVASRTGEQVRTLIRPGLARLEERLRSKASRAAGALAYIQSRAGHAFWSSRPVLRTAKDLEEIKMSPIQMRRSVAVLCLMAGLALSGAAKADPAAYDGTWTVSLASNGGLMCSMIPGLTITARNGNVSGGGSGLRVSGQVGPSGSINLALQRGGIQGSASGRMSGASGSGSWVVASVGCSGRWTAHRS